MGDNRVCHDFTLYFWMGHSQKCLSETHGFRCGLLPFLTLHKGTRHEKRYTQTYFRPQMMFSNRPDELIRFPDFSVRVHRDSTWKRPREPRTS